MAENEKVIEKAVDPAPNKKEKKSSANRKPSLGARLKIKWKEFRAEFKKIVWSSRRNTFQNTMLVIVSVLVVAVCIGALDYLFSGLITALGKLV